MFAPLKTSAVFGMLALMSLAACQSKSSDDYGSVAIMEDGTNPLLDVVQPAGPVPPAREQLAMACPADVSRAADMTRAVNAFRAAEGKVLLESEASLIAVAQTHACDVQRMGRATVAGSNGSSVVDRARAAGYPTCGVVQLVSAGGSAQSVMNGWLQSPAHREQLLGQGSVDIGVGVTTGADGRPWWSVVMGEDC